MIVECSNCKYYKTDFREEPCKSCISYRYFVPLEEAKKEETIRAEAIKEFAEKLKERATKGFWETDAYIGTEQIDELVKEMVGESNG